MTDRTRSWAGLDGAEAVRLLLTIDLVDVSRKAHNGRIPHAYAVAVGRPNLVLIIVEGSEAHIDIFDKDGKAWGLFHID